MDKEKGENAGELIRATEKLTILHGTLNVSIMWRFTPQMSMMAS